MPVLFSRLPGTIPDIRHVENLMNMPALFDLSGRVAIVTGGNGGIGRSIALGMAEAGAAVAVFARNEEKNQQVLADLKSIGVPSMALKVDMTNRTGLQHPGK
jgi:2-dehydro-3-deoxy-D-gluconate 5-dehydrogenase